MEIKCTATAGRRGARRAGECSCAAPPRPRLSRRYVRDRGAASACAPRSPCKPWLPPRFTLHVARTHPALQISETARLSTPQHGALQLMARSEARGGRRARARTSRASCACAHRNAYSPCTGRKCCGLARRSTSSSSSLPGAVNDWCHTSVSHLCDKLCTPHALALSALLRSHDNHTSVAQLSTLTCVLAPAVYGQLRCWGESHTTASGRHSMTRGACGAPVRMPGRVQVLAAAHGDLGPERAQVVHHGHHARLVARDDLRMQN
jgi:hypothetical protein